MRLITRSDFDGLVCAVLLKEVENIESVEFAHPKDVQDGKLNITSNDILTNLPYDPRVGMWFDHHSSEKDRFRPSGTFKGAIAIAPSAARVIYDYYKNKAGDKFKRYEDLMRDVDKSDSAQLTIEDITSPKGWILLSYVMDPRTGLGKFHDFEMSNRDLMMKLIDLMRTRTIDEILQDPDIKPRVDRYFENDKEFKKIMRQNSRQEENVIITDLRGMKETPAGNRFLVYIFFPDTNISVRIFDGKKGENVVVAVGHSIINRTSNTDVGALMLRYGGGGHRGAGTCQLPIAEADGKIREMIEQMKKDG
jgi:nanoRNase/pAp phosphatase (c-di-AMP/oligoRNAs hydrolase)